MSIVPFWIKGMRFCDVTGTVLTVQIRQLELSLDGVDRLSMNSCE